MEAKILKKMLKKSFLQYGRNLDVDPLSEEENIYLLQKITVDKNEESEWYEVVEDVVYSYLTNQE
ncbi:YqzH family protein [Metabacillus halosaccharovorans]|uniref:YqzH family protein n=1 Tax=Metabacillus halosaccharovorans TaxID=930124 RepID=UPI00203A678F|nr:YqzH family protein [Metabacillus halosaccharovorans]MCM3440895.1 YqzH family protein [Metabacillus halosaccharovorans]